jgi:hypothetical protein
VQAETLQMLGVALCATGTIMDKVRAQVTAALGTTLVEHLRRCLGVLREDSRRAAAGALLAYVRTAPGRAEVCREPWPRATLVAQWTRVTLNRRGNYI